MAKSNYIIHKTDSSFCPLCGSNVHLLIDRDGNPATSFYICFSCKYVAQVGVGPVIGTVKCKCKEPTTSPNCAYCGTSQSGYICGVCKEQGIDGPVILGTNRVICRIHKKRDQHGASSIIRKM